MLREGFGPCPAVSSRDPCVASVLLRVGTWHTPCGGHSGRHRASLCAAFASLYISARVVSLHRLCVRKSCVSLTGVTRCSPSRCMSMLGASPFPAKDTGRGPLSECCDHVAVCYTVPEGVPRCCVGVGAGLGDGRVSGPRPPVPGTVSVPGRLHQRFSS